VSRPVIVVHGNCVVSCLIDVLESLPGAADSFEIAGVAFARPPVEDAVLARAELIVTQNRLFGLSLPLPELVSRLPEGVPTLRMPNVMLPSLWPLSCTDPRDAPDAEHPFGRYSKSQTDSLALRIMRTVANSEARRAAYLSVDLDSVVDLGRLHEIQAEQLVQNEQDCDVQVAAYVLTTFRKQRLFYAHHHPTPALVLYLTGQILSHPRFARFRPGSIDGSLRAAAAYLAERLPFAGEEVPIHPQVGRYFGLEWWSPDLVYRLDRREFTFEQWLDAYMAEPLP